ncbi:MAG: hypothetical protein RRC34_00005, partial [Lentisphaeria bacterium]|nr:hypothetical protein [Lentisphaeria bacterium]
QYYSRRIQLKDGAGVTLTVLGRWINRDPIGEALGEALYSLVSNNPMTQVDWLGLLSCEFNMEAKWTNGPSLRIDDVDLDYDINMSPPELLDIALKIAGRTTAIPTPPVPKVHINGTATMTGTITGELDCRITCGCTHEGLAFSTGVEWSTKPHVNFQLAGSFFYDRTWEQFAKDLHDTGMGVADFLISTSPCTFNSVDSREGCLYRL